MSDTPKLPTTPGSVVWADSYFMFSRWDNWVSDGVFTVNSEELAKEDFKVIFDAGDPEQAAS